MAKILTKKQADKLVEAGCLGKTHGNGYIYYPSSIILLEHMLGGNSNDYHLGHFGTGQHVPSWMLKKNWKDTLRKLKENKVITGKALDENLNALRESKPRKKRWRTGEGNIYYYVAWAGVIRRANDIEVGYDNYRYNTGNYFETEQEARLYKQKQLIRQELEDLAMEIGEPLDWEDPKQVKYYITRNCMDNYLQQLDTSCFYALGIYSTNNGFMEIAYERIGEEKLNVLFGVK